VVRGTVALARIPIAALSVQFGDYHRPTGTGILIIERIIFGNSRIERQDHKRLDYEMQRPSSTTARC
jgi:hypothetical protein